MTTSIINTSGTNPVNQTLPSNLSFTETRKPEETKHLFKGLGHDTLSRKARNAHIKSGTSKHSYVNIPLTVSMPNNSQSLQLSDARKDSIRDHSLTRPNQFSVDSNPKISTSTFSKVCLSPRCPPDGASCFDASQSNSSNSSMAMNDDQQITRDYLGQNRTIAMEKKISTVPTTFVQICAHPVTSGIASSGTELSTCSGMNAKFNSNSNETNKPRLGDAATSEGISSTGTLTSRSTNYDMLEEMLRNNSKAKNTILSTSQQFDRSNSTDNSGEYIPAQATIRGGIYPADGPQWIATNTHSLRQNIILDRPNLQYSRKMPELGMSSATCRYSDTVTPRFDQSSKVNRYSPGHSTDPEWKKQINVRLMRFSTSPRHASLNSDVLTEKSNSRTPVSNVAPLYKNECNAKFRPKTSSEFGFDIQNKPQSLKHGEPFPSESERYHIRSSSSRFKPNFRMTQSVISRDGDWANPVGATKETQASECGSQRSCNVGFVRSHSQRIGDKRDIKQLKNASLLESNDQFIPVIAYQRSFSETAPSHVNSLECFEPKILAHWHSSRNVRHFSERDPTLVEKRVRNKVNNSLWTGDMSASTRLHHLSEPAIFERLSKQPWFHADLSRADAERLLKSASLGTFLVRLSETNSAEYSLSIRREHDVLHMKISRDPGSGYYVLGEFSQPYPSVTAMIHRYTQNLLPVRGTTPILLRFPMRRFHNAEPGKS